jgi:glycosyltransferase involved in cell wall biosynthesis
MRICLLTSSYPRFDGDIAGNFIRELCVELTGRGFVFEILTPSDQSGLNDCSDPGITVNRFRYFPFRRLQRLAYGDGMEENLKSGRFLNLLLPLFFICFVFRAFRLALRCDLVWSHWVLPSGIVGEITTRLLGKPHIITVHSITPFALSVAGRTISAQTCLTAVSRTIQSALTLSPKTLPSRSIHRIPLGVRRRPALCTAEKKELRKKYKLGDAFIILSMGRLIKIKGLHHAVRAVADMPRTLLVIAGEGPCREELVQLAKATNAPVRFAPFLRGEEKHDWLGLCDIFIAPSLVLPDGRAEGLPVSIIEALSEGKPVVACDSGGIKEVIQNGFNGLLLQPGDTDGLQRAIETLRIDKNLRTTMGNNALASASGYSIGSTADRYAELFHRCSRPPGNHRA